MASRRNSEELIFEGKVTVNGSVCNIPQVSYFIILQSMLHLVFLFFFFFPENNVKSLLRYDYSFYYCFQTRVDPARDVIYVNGNRLPKKLPPKLYLALNKPKGFVCVFIFIIFSAQVYCFFSFYFFCWIFLFVQN